jgi:hypothetical protein
MLPDDIKESVHFYTKKCKSTKFTERIYWILNDITDYPILCKYDNCKNPIRFRSGYIGVFCSHSCNSKYQLSIKSNPFSGEDGIKLRKLGMMNKYGVEHNNHLQRVIDQKRETYIKNYGVDSPLKCEEIMKKVRNTNETNGHWLPLEQFEEYKLYKSKVWHFTRKQDLKSLPNFKNRGFNKYSLDHKFSIREGFVNNIPPYIIGHVCNLEFILYKSNSKKGKLCSITLEELLVSFDTYHSTIDS